MVVLLAGVMAMACRSAAPATTSSGTSATVSAVVSKPAPSLSAPVSVSVREGESARFDVDLDGWLPAASPEQVGLDPAAVDRLVREAEASTSDSLIVIRDGRVVVERYFGRPREPIETRSLTKSVVGLVILALVGDGKIASLDAPMSTWFPELASDGRARITLRHVLSHTSGLEHGQTADDLNAAADRLAYARARKQVAPAGSRFSYNNEATQLLSGVIAVAAGEPVDAVARKRIFEPLGIRDAEWTRDRAGNVQTYFGLSLGARDLARIGLLLLEEGRLDGRQVLRAELVHEATRPVTSSPSYGLLFWMRMRMVQSPRELAALRAAGFSATTALEPLGQRWFGSEEDYFRHADPLLDASAREKLRALFRRGVSPLSRSGERIGFYGVGAQGQRLIVYPSARVVVVRQHRKRAGDTRRGRAVVAWPECYERVEATMTPLE
jgi:CubicO group peptidase (beta-lactamase class C family)